MLLLLFYAKCAGTEVLKKKKQKYPFSVPVTDDDDDNKNKEQAVNQNSKDAISQTSFTSHFFAK